MLYVTDTHALIWFLSNSDILSEKARAVFEEVEKVEGIIVIPTIVLAELLHICEKKHKKKEFSKIIEKIANGSNYTTYDLDLKIIFKCQELTKIPEIHDKIITATAKILNASIITKDKHIIDSGYVRTIW